VNGYFKNYGLGEKRAVVAKFYLRPSLERQVSMIRNLRIAGDSTEIPTKHFPTYESGSPFLVFLVTFDSTTVLRSPLINLCFVTTALVGLNVRCSRHKAPSERNIN
jgi:hypothetical protein